MKRQKRFAYLTPWFIWGLAAFFFFAHYVVRVTPGQIIEELQATFIGTTKLDIGILGASFYLPYVLMQMPVGYLVDKFGSRILLTIAVFVCSLSSFIFASAITFDMTIASRILLGFCSATAFIGALKLTTVWFEPKKLALLVGITQALGMIGAAVGSGIVPYFVDSLGWQNTFYTYSGAFFILAILIYCVVRNHPKSDTITLPQEKPKSSHFTQVLFNRYTWINALYAGFIYAPTDAMGELWGKEFLRHIHGLDPQTASFSISFLFIGWAIGGPCAGWLADRLGRRSVMIISAILGMILLPIVFYVPHIHPALIIVILFLYGLTNTGLIASYAAAGELHSRKYAGFSMAIANMLSVLLGSLLMPLLGWLLQWHAQSHTTAGSEIVLTSSDYQLSTIVLPCCCLLAVICAFFTKETLPHEKRMHKTLAIPKAWQIATPK